MKILAAGDIHGDLKIVEKLSKKAKEEKVDLVILCGDLTLAETSTSGLIGPFLKKGLKVIFVPGNHESFATADFLAELYDIKNLHGYSIKYKDIGIFGAGGATNVGPQPPISESEFFNSLKKGFSGVKDLKKKIMVTHVHPSESVSEKFTRHFKGSTAVKKAIDQFNPDILLCAHVHEAEGLEEKIGKTNVINVGRKGKIITL